MATVAQIGAFENSWLDYAVKVGNDLGISPGVILAQWGLESGYGTNSLSASNNVGSITTGAGAFASYSSPAEFATAFETLIKSRYPQAIGTGSDVASYANALGNGTIGSYFGSQSADSYAAGIQGAETALQAAYPAAWQATITGNTTSATLPPAASAAIGRTVAAATGGALSLSTNTILVVFGLVLVVAIVVGGMRGVAASVTKG